MLIFVYEKLILVFLIFLFIEKFIQINLVNDDHTLAY